MMIAIPYKGEEHIEHSNKQHESITYGGAHPEDTLSDNVLRDLN